MTGLSFRRLETLRVPTAADLVFGELYRQIIELGLPPGAKLSEQEVARQTGVSRQPVRDALYRLSQLGLIQIRPQRATTVSLISEEAVLRARFVRTALEIETVRAAAAGSGAGAAAGMRALIAEQEKAVAAGDKVGFHALDDAFHQRICAAAGHDRVWAIIRENKAHMDRVHYLSLSFGAQSALDDHKRILAAIEARDPDRAAQEIRVHLARITDIVAKLRSETPDIFAEDRA